MESPIKKLRIKKGWDQKKLSAHTGFSQAYISLIEQGNRLPTIDVLCRISEALECDINEISCVVKPKDDIIHEIESMSLTELEKVLDYVRLLKKAR